jgi:hypothetical protein
MSAGVQRTEWAREMLTGRVVWRPLGVALSLWARVGWVIPWFVAGLPYGPGLRTPYPGMMVLVAGLIGHLSAWVVVALDAPGLMAAGGRLVALLATLGVGLWTYVAVPLAHATGDPGAEQMQWQATWVVVLCLGFAWWRGGRLSAGEALEPESTLRSLFTGTLLSAAALVMFPSAATGGAMVLLPVYVGGGLAAVLLGQVEDASRRRGGRPLPFGLFWYGRLMLGVLGVVALGVAAGFALGSPPAWSIVSWVARVLGTIARILATLLAPAVEAILRLLGPVFEALIGWLRSLVQGAEPARITPPTLPTLGGPDNAAPEASIRLLGGVGAILRVLLTVVGVGVLLWMAVRTTRRPGADPTGRSLEQVEDLEEGLAKRRGQRSLGDFLRSALRLQGHVRRLYHALIVRRVYAQLLDWAAREGRPRRPAETPLEFGAALSERRPDLRDDLGVLTHAYLQVRYGERPESREMIESVRTCWERVRSSPAARRTPNEENSR